MYSSLNAIQSNTFNIILLDHTPRVNCENKKYLIGKYVLIKHRDTHLNMSWLGDSLGLASGEALGLGLSLARGEALALALCAGHFFSTINKSLCFLKHSLNLIFHVIHRIALVFPRQGWIWPKNQFRLI